MIFQTKLPSLSSIFAKCASAVKSKSQGQYLLFVSRMTIFYNPQEEDTFELDWNTYHNKNKIYFVYLSSCVFSL